MPELKTYDIFISHAWFYSKGYNRLIELLGEAPNFKYRNYSVPKHDPAIDPNSDSGHLTLTRALDTQIRPVNIVLVMAGMYSNYRYWIQKEIEIAQGYEKPIIGLVPWGQERTPTNIQEAAIEMIGWNTTSIVNAIRSYAI
jgi:hypothetical protein